MLSETGAAAFKVPAPTAAASAVIAVAVALTVAIGRVLLVVVAVGLAVAVAGAGAITINSTSAVADVAQLIDTTDCPVDRRPTEGPADRPADRPPGPPADRRFFCFWARLFSRLVGLVFWGVPGGRFCGQNLGAKIVATFGADN